MSPENGILRQLEPQWNGSLIAASIAISFLGAFTATQLMCHAKTSLSFSSVLIWSMLGSLIYGFCTIWSLHEVAMFACEFDVPIGLDAALTVISSILAVLFTFAAISKDILWERCEPRFRARWTSLRSQLFRRTSGGCRRPFKAVFGVNKNATHSAIPLAPVRSSSEETVAPGELTAPPAKVSPRSSTGGMKLAEVFVVPSAKRISTADQAALSQLKNSSSAVLRHSDGDNGLIPPRLVSSDSSSTETPILQGAAPRRHSSISGLWCRKDPYHRKSGRLFSWRFFRNECTLGNLLKGFIWSLAVTSMHYVGMLALRIPGGRVQFNPYLVALSALVSWAVCTIGCILMSNMETYLPQQLLFSVISVAGVVTLHFSGMRATIFLTSEPPAVIGGYPSELKNAVVAIAFMTCIVANVLLAHSATTSRNKLAETVRTKKELWRTIALKENAEADARTRRDFIASASHEIRTPLHHLQGYSDLLAQTQLSEEGRDLLGSIQRATQTLSMITTNVLDWSKLEQDSELTFQPVALDIRKVCESIIVLLPNIDDGANVDVFVSVAPDVPKMLLLGEACIYRTLMNLLSNALKFTKSGYILLSIEVCNGKLVAIVKDTGCGMDALFVPHMWTPFKQGSQRVGSARGTGLGLSIIKVLVQRMKGSIECETLYEHDEDVGPRRSGTTFTLTVPINSNMLPLRAPPGEGRPKLAILSAQKKRSFEGVRTCWEAYGYDVKQIPCVSDLRVQDWKYIWTDVAHLTQNTLQLQELLQNKQWTVLVPYMKRRDSLEDVPEILTAPNFVLLSKPLLWHTFEETIAAATLKTKRAASLKIPSAAADVETLKDDLSVRTSEQTSTKKRVLLLVEDNPINQKLGSKMLASLGFTVLTANDGQDALDKLLEHDRSIDAILMDQSMPRKDGITATREIRDLEARGTLSRRRPIIAVTAVVSPEARSLFEEAGADDFLAKPLSLQKLRDAVAMHVPPAE